MSPEQQKKLAAAIGDGSSFPKMTYDPEVNYEIDRHLSIGDDNVFPGDPLWNRLSKANKKIYIDEVGVMKRLK